jgi:hypothetical protein
MSEKKWYEEYTQERTPDKERISKIVQELKGPERTAAEYAEAVNLTPAMMSRIINGKYAKPLTVDVLVKLTGEDRENLERLLSANGMMSPEMKAHRQGADPWRERRNAVMIRERNMISIISNELFQRGIPIRKIPRFSSISESIPSGKFFDGRIRGDLAVEMTDTKGPYEWFFMICPGVFDTEEATDVNAEMQIDYYVRRIIERNSYLLHHKKISFVFCERVFFDKFIERMAGAKLHNRMSAILIDIDAEKVVEETSIVCSEFQDMGSPFSQPVIIDEPEYHRGEFFFFFDEDKKGDNE